MRIAVLGATGLVGRAILRLLDERSFPHTQVVALASPQSVGRQVSMGDTTLTLQNAELFDFAGINLVFSAVPSAVARRLLPQAIAAGARIIDKSSAFRKDPTAPLVVPEVNGHLITPQTRVVASPNCVAIPLSMALFPLHREAGLHKVVVSTYQSVSGAGHGALDALYSETKTVLMADVPTAKVFPRPIAFNAIPSIGDFESDGTTGEENKTASETARILGTQAPLAVTSVRVPVFVGHAMAVYAEFQEPLALNHAYAFFKEIPGLSVTPLNKPQSYTCPLDCAGEDQVFISRLRQAPSENALMFWVTCDNLRKGAALNAVQIGEILTSP